MFPGDDGTIVNTELRRDAGVIGVNSATPPVESNPWSSVLQGVYVTIDDVDAHHARALSAGARVAIPPYDTHYGSREYSAWDVQGHLWGFGTYPMGSPSGEPTIFPERSYRHEPDAVAWLARAFGFQPASRFPARREAAARRISRHAEFRMQNQKAWSLEPKAELRNIVCIQHSAFSTLHSAFCIQHSGVLESPR